MEKTLWWKAQRIGVWFKEIGQPAEGLHVTCRDLPYTIWLAAKYATRMASFNTAILTVLKHEGGYVCDPADPGGATNFGISQRAYPHLEVKSLTSVQAKAIYERDYWHPRWNDIPDQDLATFLLDMAVNMGQVPAIKLLQEAINRAGGRCTVDGVYGNQTFASLVAVGCDLILAEMKLGACRRYMAIVDKTPTSLKFLRGWLKRVLG